MRAVTSDISFLWYEEPQVDLGEVTRSNETQNSRSRPYKSGVVRKVRLFLQSVINFLDFNQMENLEGILLFESESYFPQSLNFKIQY